MTCELIEELSRLIVWMGHVTDLKATPAEAAALCASADASLQEYRGSLDAVLGHLERLKGEAEKLSERTQ